MKKKLYIDFDGVILDTIDSIYKVVEAKEPEVYERVIVNHGERSHEDFLKISHVISEIDFPKLLSETNEINNSIENINYLVTLNKFDIAILSHVNSYQEMEAKLEFINEKVDGEVDIICVPKTFDKTKATRNCKDAILIDDHSENLRTWEKAGGIGIKFSKEKREHPEFKCISSLNEIADLV